MSDFKPTSYSLKNISTGRTFDDSGWVLDDPEGRYPSLIRAEYAKSRIDVGPEEEGI